MHFPFMILITFPWHVLLSLFYRGAHDNQRMQSSAQIQIILDQTQSLGFQSLGTNTSFPISSSLTLKCYFFFQNFLYFHLCSKFSFFKLFWVKKYFGSLIKALDLLLRKVYPEINTNIFPVFCGFTQIWLCQEVLVYVFTLALSLSWVTSSSTYLWLSFIANPSAALTHIC